MCFVKDIKAGISSLLPLHLWFCSLVLFIFAFAKLGTIAARHLGYLSELPSDGVTKELVMLLAGVFELAAVILIVGFLSIRRSCQLIFLIGTAFLIYRSTLNSTRCPCMGAAPALIPWLEVNSEIILLTIPLILVLIGLWGWARDWVLSKESVIKDY